MNLKLFTGVAIPLWFGKEQQVLDRFTYLRQRLPMESVMLCGLIVMTFILGSANPVAWIFAWCLALFLNLSVQTQDKAKPFLACAIAVAAIAMVRVMLFVDLRGTPVAGQALIKAIIPLIPAVMLSVDHKKWIAIVALILVSIPVIDHMLVRPPGLFSTGAGRFLLAELLLRIGALALIGIALTRWSQFAKKAEQDASSKQPE